MDLDTSRLHSRNRIRDGHLDIVAIANDSTNNITRTVSYINNGNGSYTAGTALPENTGISNALDIGDVDNNGSMDIIIAKDAANDAYNTFLLNDESGSIIDDSASRLPTNDFSTKDVKLADVNGDGYIDVILLGKLPNSQAKIKPCFPSHRTHQ